MRQGLPVRSSLAKVFFTVLVTTLLTFVLSACGGPPQAKFTTSVASGEAPLKVTFTNSSGKSDAFNWDFGDGNTATSANKKEATVHEFTKSGVFVVKLTASRQGNVETSTATFQVTVAPGPLDHVVISPASATVEVAKSQVFAVSPRDQFDNEIPGLTASFTVDSKAGQIDKGGNFSAGTKTGQYVAAIKAEVSQGNATKTSGVNIILTPGPLAKVTVSPATAQFDIGATQQYAVEVVDQFGNLEPDAKVTWSTQQGTGDVSDKGLFTAATKAGTYSDAVKATVTLGSQSQNAGASITIKPGAPKALTVSPIKVAAGDKQQLQAVVTDQYGNTVDGVPVTWTVMDANAGSLESNPSTLVAGKVAKVFQNAIQASIPGLTTKADVAIVPGTFSQVVVGPNPIRIGLGMTQQFVAVGADQFGNRIADVTFSWALQAGGGTIGSSGLFTAGTASGTFNNTVKGTGVLAGVTQSATATVTVEPDRILFQSATLSGSSLTNFQTFIMNADGTNATQFNGPMEGADCAWSPDGRRMVCEGEDGLYVLNDDGANVRTVLATEGSTLFSRPSWSKDGRRLVFESVAYTFANNNYTYYYDIWAVDIDGGNLVKLTSTPTIQEYSPKWSPDGSQIVYWQTSTSSGSPRSVWVMNSDGSNQKQLAAQGSFNASPEFSLDGQDIVFSSTRDGPQEIYLMKADGSNVRRLTNSLSSIGNAAPSWTADGRIVYYTNKDGNMEIYIMTRDGSAQTRLTNTSDEDYYPQGAPRKAGVEVSAASLVIPNSATLTTMSTADVTATARKAVVRIETNLGVGTGFLISADGLILTANHVVRGASKVTVTLDNGTSYTATVVGRDLVRDIAVIHIGATGLPFLQIGDTGQVKLGGQVLVIGFPLGTTNLTVTSGIVSSFVTDSGRNLTNIQTDTAVNPGNSGGPMLDLQGKVVGLVTSVYAAAAAQNVNFAVSANTILQYIDRLKAGQTIYM